LPRIGENMKDNIVLPPILREILSHLATELKEPRINRLECMMTDRDFDYHCRSLFDPERKRIVAKVGENDLADAATTPVVRRHLEGRLRDALRTYYSVEQKAS
jgi:hypothetical protein